MKKLFCFILLVFVGYNINAQPLSHVPRLYLGAYGGKSFMGKADLLAPVYTTPTSNLFGYGLGRYSNENSNWNDNPWTGSFGLGYRHIVDDAAMLGIYCLGDYTYLPENKYYWVLGPGIETIGRVWEFRANGYYPLENKDWQTEGFADTFGDYSKTTFSGHNQFDHWYVYHEEIGLGADAEIGRTLAKFNGIVIKGYINGYYFDIKHNKDVIGGGARCTIQPANYAKFSLAYTYDRYEHSVFMAGLQISIYDLFAATTRKAPGDLTQHLFDPLERQFGTLGTAKSIPVVRSDKATEIGNRLERSNIQFIQPNSNASLNANVIGDGTYEHPFVDFSQQVIDTIYNNTQAPAYLYLSPGTYTAYTAGAPFQPIMLYPNQILEGRMNGDKGFLQPASGNLRPLLIGQVQLTTNDGFNNLRLKNNFALTGFDSGIFINNATGVSLNNALIGTTNTINTNYTTAIFVENNSNLSINNSQIYAYNANTTGKKDATGLLMVDDCTITGIYNSLVEGSSLTGIGTGFYAKDYFNPVTISNISNSTFTGIGYEKAAGFVVDNANYVEIKNICNSTFTGTTMSGIGAGLWANANTLLIDTISGSTFAGNVLVTGGFGCYGLYAESNVGSLAINNISNSTFTGDSVNANGYGFYAEAATAGTVTVCNISNSKFTGSTDSAGFEVGIGFSARSDTGNVTISKVFNSIFTSTSVNGSGFFADTGGTTSISAFTNNTFNTNPVGAVTSGMNLFGATVLVNGYDVDSGSEALAVLGHNTFNVGTSAPIIVNGIQ